MEITDEQVKNLVENTSMTYAQIAEELNISTTWLQRGFLNRLYTKEYLNDRKRPNYAASKTGDKNSMTGLTREKHPNFKARVADGRGYWMVLKPEWYTGRKGCNHVFEHHVVICKALGLTEIPAGWSVHHVDGDKKNNNISNLALMPMGAHSKLHRQLEKCRD